MLPRIHLLRGYCATCIRHRRDVYTSRAFGTSNVVFAEVSESSETRDVPKRATTRTKKKFSELPKQLVRPDGSIAEPLPEWTGGLEASPSISVLTPIYAFIPSTHKCKSWCSLLSILMLV